MAGWEGGRGDELTGGRAGLVDGRDGDDEVGGRGEYTGRELDEGDAVGRDEEDDEDGRAGLEEGRDEEDGGGRASRRGATEAAALDGVITTGRTEDCEGRAGAEAGVRGAA